MPTRPESETDADRELIELAAKDGYTVSRRQLRRWRTEQLLPHRSVKSRGRARGVEGLDPPDTADQLLALCGWHRIYPRSADKIAISLWYDGWAVSAGRIRSMLVKNLERELAKGRVDWGREPLSGLEKASGKFLASQDLDPAESPGASQLIRDAREDLSRIAHGERDLANSSLVAGYFQLDPLNETLPPDDRPNFDPDTTIRALDLSEVLAEIRACSDAELEAVRVHLRGVYGVVHLLPDMPESETGISFEEIPLFQRQMMSLMDIDSDTRHPEYDAGKLMSAICSCLVILRAFEPSWLQHPL